MDSSPITADIENKISIKIIEKIIKKRRVARTTSEEAGIQLQPGEDKRGSIEAQFRAEVREIRG